MIGLENVIEKQD